jgi:DNA-3-methyladenine glycosylase I
MATPIETTLADGAGWSLEAPGGVLPHPTPATPRKTAMTAVAPKEADLTKAFDFLEVTVATLPRAVYARHAMAKQARQVQRCGWVSDDPLYIQYHDEEWGVPVHDDRKLFEMITLEGAQAGLSWITILRKRQGYLRAFDGFDTAKIARYDARRVQRLMADEGIVRNRLKIESTISNARALRDLQREHGSLDAFVWSFVGGKPLVHRPRSLGEIPPSSPESDALSKGLKAHGFRFVGSTIMYAFMQACGLVDDHVVGCFRAKKAR